MGPPGESKFRSTHFGKMSLRNNTLAGEGRHGTEVAFVLLTQQPRLRLSAFPKVFLFSEILIRCCRDLSTAVLPR